MMITFYCPEELGRKIKGNRDINISKICQDALREKDEELSNAINVSKNRARLQELRKQKDAALERSFSEGACMGRHFILQERTLGWADYKFLTADDLMAEDYWIKKVRKICRENGFELQTFVDGSIYGIRQVLKAVEEMPIIQNPR